MAVVQQNIFYNIYKHIYFYIACCIVTHISYESKGLTTNQVFQADQEQYILLERVTHFGTDFFTFQTFYMHKNTS